MTFRSAAAVPPITLPVPLTTDTPFWPMWKSRVIEPVTSVPM